MGGQVLRVDGADVQRVNGWHIDGIYTSADGEAAKATELGMGLRKLYGAFPQGLVIK